MASNIYGAESFVKNLKQFLSGKVITAVFTLACMLLLVKLLSPQEYGEYIAYFSAMELLIFSSSLGIPWMAVKFIPEFKVSGNDSRLAGLVFLILFSQVVVVSFSSVLALFFFDRYASFIGLTYSEVVGWCVVLLFAFEAISRLIRDNILGSLMEQGSARLMLVVRQGFLLFVLVFLYQKNHVNLLDYLYFEVIASFISLIIGILVVIKIIFRQKKINVKDLDIHAYWKFSIAMYASQISSILFSPQLLLNLSARFMSIEAVGMLGFVRNITEQCFRYLPSTLFFGIIRPKIIADFNTNGIQSLSRSISFISKLNIFAIFIILSFVYSIPNEVLSYISSGKYNESGFLFILFLIVLIPYSQRQIFETAAVTLDLSFVCLISSLVASCTIFIFFLLMKSVLLKDFSLVITLFLSYSLYNFVILSYLKSNSHFYYEIKSICKLIFSFLISVCIVTSLSMMFSMHLAFLSIFHFVVFFMLSYWVKVFSDYERNILYKNIKNRVFSR